MKSFHVSHFGPIAEAKVSFGDLTFIIGEQASGKSLFLELLKLSVDRGKIIETLQHYNFVLQGKAPERLLDYFFGEGMSTLWTDRTEVILDNKSLALNKLPNQAPSAKARDNQLFYIPAQRILGLDDGRPKSFTEFNQASTPYVLRDFSETLRLFLQIGLDEQGNIYPRKNRLKGKIKRELDRHLFHHGRIIMEDTAGQQKMKLAIGESRLPFLAWSAGQKEFTPLLLAIYCLTGPPIPIIKSNSYQVVVIEEPEMGLHASAIRSVLLQILDLVSQGKQVIVSTHSTLFLEFAWAFRRIQSSPQAVELLLDLFQLGHESDAMRELFEQLLRKRVSSYLFHRKGNKQGVYSSDISPLDPFSEVPEEVSWGGLSSFAERASEIVSRVADED